MTFPRFSQAPTDDRGNLNFLGDLWVANKPFTQLAADIDAHINTVLAPTQFKVVKSIIGNRRRIEVSVVAADVDLRDETVRADLLRDTLDEVHRFGYDRSNPQTDLHIFAFMASVNVGAAYWAARQRLSGPDLIDDRMTVTRFRKAIKPDDTLEVLHGENAGRVHRVIDVGKRFVTDDGLTAKGRFHWDFPISEAFLSDGVKIRISKGTTERPDEYQLLHWVRQNPE